MPIPHYTAGIILRRSLLKQPKGGLFSPQLQDYFAYPFDEALPPSASLYAQKRYLLLLFTAFDIQFLLMIAQNNLFVKHFLQKKRKNK